MQQKRRTNDNNMMKRLWENYAFYFHIIGFLIMCIFTVGLYFDKFQAQARMVEDHDQRIMMLENGQNKITQKLDDMIDFFHIPHRGR